MARPTKPDAEKVLMKMSLRLTEVDHAAYLAKCHAAGLTRSEFLRECVLRNRTQVVACTNVPPNRDKLRVLFLLGKTSNNINQLAYRANSDHLAGILSESTYWSILLELNAITKILKESHAA